MDYCGNCNNVCVLLEMVCMSGVCSCFNIGDFVCGIGVNKVCVNLDISVSNCGVCGIVCVVPIINCVLGVCVCFSVSDLVCGIGVDKVCVNL